MVNDIDIITNNIDSQYRYENEIIHQIFSFTGRERFIIDHIFVKQALFIDVHFQTKPLSVHIDYLQSETTGSGMKLINQSRCRKGLWT